VECHLDYRSVHLPSTFHTLYTQEDNEDPMPLLDRDGKYPAFTQPQQYAGLFGSRPAAD